MNMADNYICKNLKKLRLNKGITQEQIAKELKIHRTTYTKGETGKSEPSISDIIRIVNYYNVDFNTIFDPN